MAYIKNWRDVQPKIAHMSAVHWGGLRSKEREDDEDDRNRLARLGGFARHALQGRKTSDHHKHEKLEQVYYVLGGQGEVLFEGTRYPVEDGDAIYLPSGLHHQMFNDNEEWLAHHVISMSIEDNGGDFKISNWRQVAPVGDGAGAVRWHQLKPQGQGEVETLKGMHFIDREAVQPRGRTIERVYESTEQVYYILENKGVLVAEGREEEIVEGDMIHIPEGMEYYIKNPHEDWFTYMIMAA